MRQFRNEELGFIEDIRANPEDDDLRLIYADWLEEHDDPLGELIRIQCELDNSRRRLGSFWVKRKPRRRGEWLVGRCHSSADASSAQQEKFRREETIVLQNFSRWVRQPIKQFTYPVRFYKGFPQYECYFQRLNLRSPRERNRRFSPHSCFVPRFSVDVPTLLEMDPCIVEYVTSWHACQHLSEKNYSDQMAVLEAYVTYLKGLPFPVRKDAFFISFHFRFGYLRLSIELSPYATGEKSLDEAYELVLDKLTAPL